MDLLTELNLAHSGLNELFTTQGSFQKIGLGDLLMALAVGESGGGVTTFNGRSGIVVSQTGDYTTTQVTEGSNLYFTTTRVLATTLAGYVSNPGTITSADTILSAIEKLNGNNVKNDPGGNQYSIQTNGGSGDFSGDSFFLYDGSQATFNLIDNWGGLHITGRSGGEASIALHPDNVANGAAGQWILATNGSGLSNAKDFAIYNAPSGIALTIQQSTNNIGIGTVNPSYKLDVNGTMHGAIAYIDNYVSISSAAGQPSITNPGIGVGVIIQGIDSVGYGQLRIVANSGGWADAQETVYFQMRNSINNMATFMGGSSGSDAPLDRLQFCSEFTTVTDGNYTATPVPTHLQEFVNATSGKAIVAIIDVSGTPGNYLEITSQAGPSGDVFKIDSSGGLSLGSGATSINGVPYIWPSSQGGTNSILKNDGFGNLTWGVSESIINTLTTTNNTPVPIYSVGLPNTSIYYFEAVVTARYANGSNVQVFEKNVAVRAEVSSSPSIVAPGVTTIFETNGLVLYVDWVIVGSSLQLQVTGDPSASVNWTCFVNIYPQNN